MNLKSLTHVVECKYPGKPFFEIIAAFNCVAAADAYRCECEEANCKMGFTYQSGPLIND